MVSGVRGERDQRPRRCSGKRRETYTYDVSLNFPLAGDDCSTTSPRIQDKIHGLTYANSLPQRAGRDRLIFTTCYRWVGLVCEF